MCAAGGNQRQSLRSYVRISEAGWWFGGPPRSQIFLRAKLMRCALLRSCATAGATGGRLGLSGDEHCLGYCMAGWRSTPSTDARVDRRSVGALVDLAAAVPRQPVLSLLTLRVVRITRRRHRLPLNTVGRRVCKQGCSTVSLNATCRSVDRMPGLDTTHQDLS